MTRAREEPVPDHVQSDARGRGSTPDANSEGGDLATRLRSVESTSMAAASVVQAIGTLTLIAGLVWGAVVVLTQINMLRRRGRTSL